MLRCKDVTQLIASGDVERASRVLRVQVWLHLRMCEHCSRYAAQLETIGRAARDLFGAGEDDSAARKQLERVILDGVKRGSPEGRDPDAPAAP